MRTCLGIVGLAAAGLLLASACGQIRADCENSAEAMRATRAAHEEARLAERAANDTYAAAHFETQTPIDSSAVTQEQLEAAYAAWQQAEDRLEDAAEAQRAAFEDALLSCQRDGARLPS